MTRAHPSEPLTSTGLAEVLLEAVRTQRFEETLDSLQDNAPVGAHPSLDLAVAAFGPDGDTVFANVLFSREHPAGLVAAIAPDAGPVSGVHFLADRLDAQGRSEAWLPGADWHALAWRTLAGAPGMPRVVAPYPGSLIKLMVLVAVARQVDRGSCQWTRDWAWQGRSRPVGDWAFDMTVVSCNDATSALVSLLHATGALRREADTEVLNDVHHLFESYGLGTLRLANTRADGGWRNADGAGVGQLQMTAWDTVRLLWLLDRRAPPPPWLPAGTPPLLSTESRDFVLHCLSEQGLHESLSSSLLAQVPGWVAGIPAQVPARWIGADGSARLTPELAYPGDIRPWREHCDVRFSHKTGNTENYCSDAGIVEGVGRSRRHYLIAMLSNLGTRYAPDPHCATTWRVSAMAQAIDSWLRERLEVQA